jgi:ADP-heptose:LPS heptosyltransferase
MVKDQLKEKVCVYTFYPEVFDDRYVKTIGKNKLLIYRYLAKFFPAKFRCHDLYYTSNYQNQENQEVHLLEYMAKNVGLKLEKLNPVLAFDLPEAMSFEREQGCFYIGIHSTGSDLRLQNKFYYPERFNDIVKLLKSTNENLKFIQLGMQSDPLLSAVDYDFRGKTSVRGSIHVLRDLDLFVGLVGFLMHAAAAVATKSVIIFGGREKPSQSGYAQNRNITSDIHCSPCWAYDCPIDRQCMKDISVLQVVEAVNQEIRLLRNQRSSI